MNIVIVVNNPEKFGFNLPGIEVISAKDYISNNSPLISIRNLKVFNLCRSYKYQSIGYYISLLATARGHRAIPSIRTIQDTRYSSVVRSISWELDALVQKSLSNEGSSRYSFNIYFGKCPEPHLGKLAVEIFNLFEAPLIRVDFACRDIKWRILNIQMIALNEIPESSMAYVAEYAQSYFSRKTIRRKKYKKYPYDMAILVNPEEKKPPSDPGAVKRFVKAAEKAGFAVEIIGKNDFSQLPEYDALFIRETTGVNHYTFRFAQKAYAEDIVVIDDPDSIIKCCNKVYLAELLKHHQVNTPNTLVVNKDNYQQIITNLSFPVILKQPDSYFSQGVKKVDNSTEYFEHVKKLLQKSDLVIAQEFMPTDFDWRVGVIDNKPLYVCKYFMAEKHWQIVEWMESGALREGRWETCRVEDASPRLIRTALKAAGLIGNGFYGIDIKEVGKKYYVIEINDNPSIDRGVEDAVLKDGLYQAIMDVFRQRVDRLKSLS